MDQILLHEALFYVWAGGIEVLFSQGYLQINFFGMAQWLRLGVLARRRSHREMFTVVTFMSPPGFFYSNTEVFVPLPAGIAEGWMVWCDVARDSTCGNKTWQKSCDRAEMAQTGQNYHYFLKRAENQNDQNLMVVWWYRGEGINKQSPIGVEYCVVQKKRWCTATPKSLVLILLGCLFVWGSPHYFRHSENIWK